MGGYRGCVVIDRAEQQTRTICGHIDEPELPLDMFQRVLLSFIVVMVIVWERRKVTGKLGDN